MALGSKRFTLSGSKKFQVFNSCFIRRSAQLFIKCLIWSLNLFVSPFFRFPINVPECTTILSLPFILQTFPSRRLGALSLKNQILCASPFYTTTGFSLQVSL